MPTPDLEVHFQPPPPDALADATAIVLDIFRATTVHAALFAGGARAVYPVADFAAGIALRDALPGSRLIGEVGALPPPEADFGNSPTEFAAIDVCGWTVVHVTSNGTRALVGASQADLTLSGCLRNMSASVRHALAERPERLSIVCSGDHGGAAPSVEDTFAAGAYVTAIKRASPDTILKGGAPTGAQALPRLRSLALARLRRLTARRSLARAGLPGRLQVRRRCRLGFDRDCARSGWLRAARP